MLDLNQSYKYIPSIKRISYSVKLDLNDRLTISKYSKYKGKIQLEVKGWKKQLQLSSLRKWSRSNNTSLLRQKVSLEVKRGIS